MSIARFRPEIWSAILLTTLKKALVYAAPGVVNRNYEGEIENAGDTVRITSVSRPTVRTHQAGVPLVREQLTDAQRTLVIDQAKYFDFEVDDVDRRQTAGDALLEGMREAAYGLRDVADQFVAALYTGVAAGNNLGTIVVAEGTPTDAYDKILIPLKVKLDEVNVPTESRYCIVPPWVHGRLLRDSRFVKVNESGTDEGLRNGLVGRAAGFEIRMSNNTPAPAADQNVVQAGHPMAISYAEQINKTEAFRPEDGFADAVKGLHLYGSKLLRPEAIAIATADHTA